MKRYRMDQFFKWLSTPMDKEDIDTWNRANNIIPEYCDLFEDFSFSLYYLISETYLGFSHGDSNATKIGVMNDDKLEHFRWCFDKVILDFKKENITFNFSSNDYDFFESFYMEVYYEQLDGVVRDSIESFLRELFNRRRTITKPDLEMFTDLYKSLERSVQL